MTLDILEPSASDHRGASAGIVIGHEWGLPTQTGLFFHNRKGKLLLRMPLNQIFDDCMAACDTFHVVVSEHFTSLNNLCFPPSLSSKAES